MLSEIQLYMRHLPLIYSEPEYMIHPKNLQLHNVQLQNVQLQNLHLPYVQLQNVQVTKRPGYQTSILQNVQITKRPGLKTSSFRKFKKLFKKPLPQNMSETAYFMRSMR
jgi:hypothetical protein